MDGARAEVAPFACQCTPDPGARRAWLRLAGAALLAANSVTLSLGVNLSETARGERLVLHGVLLAIAIAVALLTGVPSPGRRFSIEWLFLAGLAGALGTSTVSVVRGDGPVFFEVIPVLLVVHSFGRRVTEAAGRRILEPLRGADNSAAAPLPGEIVSVPPGGLIPADGEIVSGEAFVRESEITGEFLAAARRPGDRVFAGSATVDGLLEIRVKSPPGDQLVDQLARLVEEARRRPSRLERQADKAARLFLPVVMACSLATLAGWLPSGWETALFHSLAVLLVACPCAMGFAVPVVIWTALRRLADLGFSGGGGEGVEKLALVDTAVFDKTGTLSDGAMRLESFRLLPSCPVPEDDLRRMVAAVESASPHHPVAAAFAGEDNGGLRVSALRLIPGSGLRAVVAGRCLTVLRDGDGIAIAVDGIASAEALITERLAPSVPAALAALERLGVQSVLMTGDSAARAARAGFRDTRAALSPLDKQGQVERLRGEGKRVVYVGDGVNDAPAMASADLAVALASGAPLASAAAGFLWKGGDLTAVPAAIAVCRESMALARSCLWFAAFYNVIGMAVAASGMIHPVTATLLMMCSSLSVIWRAAGPLAESAR